MSNDIKKLLTLQECDLRIVELENSKKEFPIRVAELEKAIADAAGTVEETKERIEEITNEKKAAEEQIANAKLSLEKSQERLNTIRTNKEYDAVHAEIESAQPRYPRMSGHMNTSSPDRVKERRTSRVSPVSRW